MEKKQKAAAWVLSGVVCAIVGCAGSAIVSERNSTAAVGRDSTSFVASTRMTPVSARSQEPGEVQPASPRMTVVLRDGMLTLRVRNARLNEVLSAISRVADISFDLEGEAGEQVSIDVGPLPLQEAILNLLNRASYSYASIDDAGTTGQPGRRHMLLVRQSNSIDTGRPGMAQVAPAPAAMPASPADDAAMQQQRSTDSLFDACRASACDSS